MTKERGGSEYPEASAENTAPGALDGIRVLELSTVVMGPYAAQVLGDLGADVIKVETGKGDMNRFMGGGPPGMSGISLTVNRNKRSVRLDLKKPEGREAFLRILDTCDVFVTNVRPGALKRLGLDYETVGPSRPRLVYLQAAGFRTGTDEENRPAYDDIIQASTGLPRLSEVTVGKTAFLPTIMGDKVAGMTVLSAALAALLRRERTGRGQRVEVAMFDAVMAFNLTEHLSRAAIPGGEAGYSRIMTGTRGPHQTADGFVAMMPYSDKDWAYLFTLAGKPEMMKKPYLQSHAARLLRAEEAYGALAEIVIERTTDEWLRICAEADIPVNPVPSLGEIVADEKLHRGMITMREHPVIGPYRSVRPGIIFDESPMSIRRHAPMLGENTEEILAEVGYDEEEIERITWG
jgi:crotonobetainyl-CoA:carnitine CoA-transferase CaiB-like acyl-CoA transferase